ncbi:unnamed protein product, partial [Brassica oleracea]
MPAETLQGFDHLLGFGLSANLPFVKFSTKAMTPPKMCLRFDIVLVNCRNVYMIYCARRGRARSLYYYVTAASQSQYTVSSIDGSSQSRPYNPPPLSSLQELLC